MKKFLSILFLLLIFNLFCLRVSAQECFYNYDKNSNFSLKINEEKQKIEYGLAMWNLSKDFLLLDPYVDSKYNEQYIIKKLNGNCMKKAYACEGVNYGWKSQTIRYFLLLNTSLYSRLSELNTSYWIFWDRITVKVGGATYKFSYDDCTPVFLDEKKSNVEGIDEVFECDIFNKHIKNMKSYFKQSNMTLYNNEKNQLKSYCNSVTQHSDFIDNCLINCIENLEKEIELIEKNNSNKDLECSLSDRLISWIANIIKWLKYIVPVIVIIFGILDFIKAMSADKDDEMKKAQSKFIKRLIAAALIFLIPLIVGFVLEQLGFEVTGCGIIKELD